MYNHVVNNRLVCIICLMWGFIDGSVSGMNRIKTATEEQHVRGGTTGSDVHLC